MQHSARPPLAPDEARKDPGIAGIATGQSPRFGDHAMQPLQTAAAHPDRCLAFLTRNKIDGRADAERDARGKLPMLFMHPDFLLRSAQSDDNHIRPCLLQVPQDLPLFGFVLLKAQRGAVGSHDVDVRPLRFDAPCRAVGDPGAAPSRNTRNGRCAVAAANSAGTSSEPATRSGSGLFNSRDARMIGSPSASTR